MENENTPDTDNRMFALCIEMCHCQTVITFLPSKAIGVQISPTSPFNSPAL